MADYSALLAKLEGEREELKDCSRLPGNESALDPFTAQRIANTMFAAEEAISALERELEEAYVRGLRDSLQSQLEEREFANRPPLGPWSREEIEHVRAVARDEPDPIKQRALRLFIKRMPTQADVEWAERTLAQHEARLSRDPSRSGENDAEEDGS